MLKPVCIKCQRFYRVVKNGFFFMEGMPFSATGTVKPGTEDSEKWKPYKLWSGDKWQCMGCGHELISGVGKNPIAEHYQAHFEDSCRSFPPEVQVNDC